MNNNPLVILNCTRVKKSDPVLGKLEVEMQQSSIPEWEFFTDGTTHKIKKSFSFQDFKTAHIFLNMVADVAEDEDHHPQLLLEWGKVTVTWWTHFINGLHKNDLIMAAKTDYLYQSLPQDKNQ